MGNLGKLLCRNHANVYEWNITLILYGCTSFGDSYQIITYISLDIYKGAGLASNRKTAAFIDINYNQLVYFLYSCTFLYSIMKDCLMKLFLNEIFGDNLFKNKNLLQI